MPCPRQRYVESILSSRSISGENLKLLNVKYIMLVKEVDWAWYRDVLEESDLEFVFDSENLMLYRNPELVSRFYGADNLFPGALAPLGYDIISPVEYRAAASDKRCTVFVPPNLDSSDWLLDGEGAPLGFYAAWENDGGKVEYSRFRTYEVSYAISLASAVVIAVVYSILRKLLLEK